MHYASQMKDEEGNGRTLIHYSYIELKRDAIEWLTQHGRLPATSMALYTEEVGRLFELEQESSQQKKEITRLTDTVQKLHTTQEGFREAEVLIQQHEESKSGS